MLAGYAISAQDKPTVKKQEELVSVTNVEYERVKPDPSDPDAVFYITEVDVLPSYPGGVKKFIDDVREKIDTSDNNAPSGSKFRLFVNFNVEKDGTISKIKVPRDPGYGFAKEVGNSVKQVKAKWEPGKVEGKEVRVNYSLPIVIEVP